MIKILTVLTHVQKQTLKRIKCEKKRKWMKGLHYVFEYHFYILHINSETKYRYSYFKRRTRRSKVTRIPEIVRVQKIKIQFPKLSVPVVDHSYVCMEYDLPYDRDYHVTAGLPIIDNRNVLGGVFLYACDSHSNTAASKHPYECGYKPRGDCRNFLGGYSKQIPGICFHRNTGFKIGRTGCRKVVLQVRWDNQNHMENMIDGSGLTLYFTNNLRRYDAGTKLLSLTHFTIPAQRPIYAVSTTYPSQCSLVQITSPIYITRAFNHMHQYGKQERVEVLRDGKVVNLLTDERYYNMHNPKTYWHTNPVQVLPGDILRITCVYGAKDSKHPISWGHLSTNEICASTIEYYPKSSWTASTCASFKSIPLCQLEATGIAKGCNFIKLFETLRKDNVTHKILKECSDGNLCNPSCKSISRAASAHPCLKGDCLSLLKSPVTSHNAKLETFFHVLNLCGTERSLQVIQQQRLND
nr:P-U1 [Pinctada fucata]